MHFTTKSKLAVDLHISHKIPIINTYSTNFLGLTLDSTVSWKTHRLQKRAIRTIMNVGNRISCRELFEKLNFLPLYSQYILSLLLFVVKNTDEFTMNSEVHTINTQHRSDLPPPSVNMNKYQKVV
jgi:hypothetical protein